MNFMGSDHDKLDGIFKKFRDSRKDLNKARELFREFKTSLQRHIVWEEEILFPLFENKTASDNGPTAVMRTEHRKIKDFLEKIHDKISQGDARTDNLGDGLIEVLTGHNYKEEGILYPWIDNSVSEKERAEAFRKMQDLPPEKYNQCCKS